MAALLTHSALIQAVAFLLRPASTYQAIDLGFSVPALGTVGAVFAIVPLFLAIPAGSLVDRFGARIIMGVGSVLVIAAAATLTLTGDTVLGLFIGVAVLGAGHLGCIVGQQAVVADSAGGSRLDAMFGYYTFAASLGQAIGPLVLLLVGTGTHPDTSVLFAIGTAMGVAMLAVTFFIRRRPPQATEHLDQEAGGSWQLIRQPGLFKAIATSAVIVSAVDLTVIYIPALGAERGLTAAVVGILLAVRAVFSMGSRLFLGMMTRRLGRQRLMVGSIAVSAVTLVAIAIPAPLGVTLVIVALLGVGLGVGQPLTMSWLVERTPPHRRGSALALRLAGNRLSMVLFPTLVGGLAGALGAGPVFILAAGAVGSTLLLTRSLGLASNDD